MSLYHAFLLTGFHLFGVCPVAEQKPYRPYYDTLARSGFSRNDGKASVQVDVEFIYKGKVSYV
jgi:hypothetical protein